MEPPPDLFDLLGLPADADPKRVQKAFRARVMAWHPDKHPGDANAAAQYKALNAAYSAWSAVHAARPPAGPQPLADLDVAQFEEIFEQFLGASSKLKGAGRGRDLRVPLRLTAAEAARGAKREIRYQNQGPCSTCDGTGATPGTEVRDCAVCQGTGQTQQTSGMFRVASECAACSGRGRRPVRPCDECREGFVTVDATVTVTVPPGVQVGQTLRLAGKGEPGTGDKPGDLYAALEIVPGVEGTRAGDDAVVEVALTREQAAAGHTVTVCAPGGTTDVVIPGGVRSGARVVVPGHGFPRAAGGEGSPTAYRDAAAHGDLVVVARVPGGLSPRVGAVLVGVGLVAATVAAVLVGRG